MSFVPPPPPPPCPSASSSSSQPKLPTEIDKNVQPCSKYIHDSCTGIYYCGGITCTTKSRYNTRVAYGILEDGTPTITGDSVCCLAALHLGIIPMSGGCFQLQPCGQFPNAKFVGAEPRNGVKITPWSRGYGECFKIVPYAVGGNSAVEPAKSLKPMTYRETVKCLVKKDEEYF